MRYAHWGGRTIIAAAVVALGATGAALAKQDPFEKFLPDDVLAFVSDFPTDLKDQIVAALVAHIATPEGLAIWNNKKFYQWSGMSAVADSAFDGMRALLGYAIPER